MIPTFRRADLVRRAAASALAQTVEDLEVLVVADGDDADATAATEASLASLADPRLRVLVPGRPLGNGAARNFGVDHATAPLVALLDDDDEWFPRKLETQMPLCDGPNTLVTHRLEARVGENEVHLWPRRRPREGEDVGEYLFCPRRPGTGEGMIQTSTWLLPTDLLRRVRFAEGLRRYVDLDWIVRAAKTPGFRVAFAGWPEALGVWNIEPKRVRISTSDDGQFAVDWANERRDVLTPRAHAGFLLTLASQSAAASGRRPGFWRILREAFKNGRPTLGPLASHALHFGVPRGLLHAAARRRS